MDRVESPTRENLHTGDLYVSYDKFIPPGEISTLRDTYFEYNFVDSKRCTGNWKALGSKKMIVKYGLGAGKYYRRNKEGKLKLLFRTIVKNINNWGKYIVRL